MNFQLDTIQEIYATSKQISLAANINVNHGISRVCQLFQKLSEAILADPENLLEDFHDSYPQLIDCIFGGGGFVGLLRAINDAPKDQSNCELYNQILSIFTPERSFFDLIKLLLKEGKSYMLPVETLPAPLYSVSYPEQQPKLAIFLKGRAIFHESRWKIRLSAYELYIYSCLSCPVQNNQNPATISKAAASFFAEFLGRVLDDVFPLEISSFEKASHLKIYFSEGLSNESSSLPRFFLDIFFELWLSTDSWSMEDPVFVNQAEYRSFALGAPGLEPIKKICLYFQKGCACFLAPDDGTAGKLLRNFWQSLQIEFQPRFFHFLKEFFTFQQFSNELLWAVELWVSYITPWMMDGHDDFTKYSMFIADNYLFYKELLLDFLYRCLESHFIAESLGRTAVLSQSESMLLHVLQIYNDQRVLDVLREADAALSSFTSSQVFLFSVTPETSAACFSVNLSNSGRFDATLKAHLTRFGDSPVFNTSLVSSRRAPSWKKDLHSVFSDLARLLDPSTQANLGATPQFPPLPTHTVYEYLTNVFHNWTTPSQRKRSIELAQSNYLTKQQYQHMADLIAKILNIPV